MASSSQIALPEYVDDIFGWHAGTTTLTNVQGLMGQSPFHVRGDAASSETFICYVIRDTNQSWIVTFTSDNELADVSSHELTGIELTRLDAGLHASNDCTVALDNRDVMTLVRMSETDFMAKFSPPVVHKGEYGGSICVENPIDRKDPAYQYWRGKKNCFPEGKEPYVNVCTTWGAQFRDKVLTKLTVKRVSSVC
ncbi:MAG: hypothetical protein U1F34_00180 [Gammaproteobacteria bacterium]